MRHCAREARYVRPVIGDGLVVSFSAILVGLYAGLARGGLLRNLGAARIEWWGLLVAGVTIPLFVDRADPSRGVTLVTLSLLALVVFALRNRALAGMTIVAFGLCTNLAVVVLNDGMPVREQALVSAGLATPDDVGRVEISGVQRLEREGDRLVLLADVIPVAATRQVLSFGDLVILAGLADVAANLLLGRRRARPLRPPRPARLATPPREPVPRVRNIPEFDPIVFDDPAPPATPDRELVSSTSSNW
jgi:hypothetical protein